MFRKIHSNRDPNDTLVSEIKKEFKFYFEKASKTLTQKMEQRPKFTFGVMVFLMTSSAVLCFTVFRNKAPAAKDAKTVKVNAVSDGFSQILSVSTAIKQTLALKHQVDSLTRKKSLSKSDSDMLLHDLNKLHQTSK
jgi:hypothetical protein